MKLLRNRAFLLEILVSVSLLACFTLLSVFFSGVFLLPVFGILLIGVHVFFTSIRYLRIKRLSEDLERILHGQADLLPARCMEGELSILETEISKMTMKLRENSEKLLRDKHFLENAVSDISHQLRTPLTAMNVTLAMLNREDVSEESRKRYTHEMMRSLRKLDWLIESLLKMSRLDAGTIPFVKKRVSVREVLKSSVATVEILAELRAQSLTLISDDETWEVDPHWTAEAISNILKNAVEHTPEGGTIQICARETPLFTELTVTDTGNGFDPQDMPHLFERFYKGKGSAEDSIGIGLALSHAIITRQGGLLRAENVPGGARFVLRFYKTTV